jgi:hypothetical protein
VYRFQPLLFQPVPSLLGYSISSVVEEMRAAYFPEIEDQFEVRFAAEGPLAYISRGFMGSNRHLVVFHPVLNHPQTPIEVLRFVAKHELAHVARPPRAVCGEYEAHPPEFWKLEAAVAPERRAAWWWIDRNFSRCGRHGERGYSISRTWRRRQPPGRTPFSPMLPFDGERYDRACPGEGAQLRLPADWPPLPLPCQRRGYGRSIPASNSTCMR